MTVGYDFYVKSEMKKIGKNGARAESNLQSLPSHCCCCFVSRCLKLHIISE